MFKNVGKKLQGLATFLCIAGIIGCVVSGILMIRNGSQLQNYYAIKGLGLSTVIYGVLIIIVGSFVTWICCWGIAALGQATENTEKLMERIGDLESELYKLGKKLENSENDKQIAKQDEPIARLFED